MIFKSSYLSQPGQKDHLSCWVRRQEESLNIIVRSFFSQWQQKHWLWTIYGGNFPGSCETLRTHRTVQRNCDLDPANPSSVLKVKITYKMVPQLTAECARKDPSRWSVSWETELCMRRMITNFPWGKSQAGRHFVSASWLGQGPGPAFLLTVLSSVNSWLEACGVCRPGSLNWNIIVIIFQCWMLNLFIQFLSLQCCVQWQAGQQYSEINSKSNVSSEVRGEFKMNLEIACCKLSSTDIKWPLLYHWN